MAVGHATDSMNDRHMLVHQTIASVDNSRHVNTEQTLYDSDFIDAQQSLNGSGSHSIVELEGQETLEHY